MNTEGWGGRNLSHTITVFTNDEQNQQMKLAIKGFVEEFVDMDPKVVRLNGKTDETIKVSVRINPREKYPFNILNIRVHSGDSINYELSALGPENSAPYILHIENTKTEPGNYTDFIYLDTDSKIKPEIRIRILGTIFASESQQPRTEGGASN